MMHAPPPAQPPAEPAAPPPPETRAVASRRVACDGDEGALGHPRIWLQIDARGYVDCPYCDRRFILQGTGAGDHP